MVTVRGGEVCHLHFDTRYNERLARDLARALEGIDKLVDRAEDGTTIVSLADAIEARLVEIVCVY